MKRYRTEFQGFQQEKILWIRNVRFATFRMPMPDCPPPFSLSSEAADAAGPQSPQPRPAHSFW